MNGVFVIVAILVGALVPFQGAINARLGSELAQPLFAVLVSYIVGLFACVVILLLIQREPLAFDKLFALDGYLYLGGALGALFVTGMMFLIPKVGVATMLMATIVGQLLVSLALDHYGAFGMQELKISASKIAGSMLLILGLYFIQR